MTNTELENIRISLGFSKADMARIAGLPKTTMQRYFDGSAGIPADVAAVITEYHHKEKNRERSYWDRMNQELDQIFPHGIPAEAM